MADNIGEHLKRDWAEQYRLAEIGIKNNIPKVVQEQIDYFKLEQTNYKDNEITVYLQGYISDLEERLEVV